MDSIWTIVIGTLYLIFIGALFTPLIDFIIMRFKDTPQIGFMLCVLTGLLMLSPCFYYVIFVL